MVNIRVRENKTKSKSFVIEKSNYVPLWDKEWIHLSFFKLKTAQNWDWSNFQYLGLPAEINLLFVCYINHKPASCLYKTFTVTFREIFLNLFIKLHMHS